VNAITWEEHVVREATRLYGTQGYTLELGPKLPHSLEGLGQIDAIAHKGSERVFIQFKRLGRSIEVDSETSGTFDLIEAVEKIPNARLDVFALPDPSDALPDKDSITERASAARALVAGTDNLAQVEAAILLSTSALEGILRVLAVKSGIFVDEDLSLESLSASLWSNGFLGDNQREPIQRLAGVRNAIAHGLVSAIEPTRDDVALAATLAEEITEEVFVTPQDLIDWFLEHYEGPEQHVPHDSSEGGYQYFGGGPYDASDVLADRFSNAPLSVHTEAVEHLNDISTDWVRIGDY
jgi:hypothetical protein